VKVFLSSAGLAAGAAAAALGRGNRVTAGGVGMEAIAGAIGAPPAAADGRGAGRVSCPSTQVAG